MGTRGYRVYRYRGWYHVYYNHYDSYPDGLGLEVAAEVPTGDPEAYQKWLEVIRAKLDKDFEENPDCVENEKGKYTITREQPSNDLFIEWIYEIDLDHEVFLVDSEPLFALNAMPDSRELFLESIGFDSYGHRSYSKTTPEKHLYNWTSAPPAVEDSAIMGYTVREQDSELSVTDLLGITGFMGNCQTVRIELYQLLVSSMMADGKFGSHIRRLEASPDRSHIPDDLLGLGVAMVNATIGLMPFIEDIPHIPENVEGFVWLSSNICLHITTHLDDERNRKKDLLRLVDEIVRARDHPEIKYGILFSFFHCVIVSVDANNSFKCTLPLQFLPSFHTTSPSTPGITAVATSDIVNPLPADHILSRVPKDVWLHITKDLIPLDLRAFVSSFPWLEDVANDILRFPHLGDYRLVEAIGPEMEPKQGVLRRKWVFAKFSAVCGGSSVDLTFGRGKHKFNIYSRGGRARHMRYGVDE
ncbi:hypothetical protein C8J57DRAFT_1282266 [Mycena rebaudengoi]|nr:hypothetical protein C8J57DRAFT_1282266 [Mycena rebaudengoi]